MAADAPPLAVILAVGLTPAHLGPDTPFLADLAQRGGGAPLAPELPAVTTTAQTSMLTGVGPDRHGIVANGWHFRDLGEVWLWRQSQALVQAPCVWQTLRGHRPLRVLKHFWWYAMNSDCDAVVTPRPAYHADGRKSPGIYTRPADLGETLRQRHGEFPLFHFWGPTASLRSSRWIADSFTTAWDATTPDLALCYLPHLDYDLQRFGPAGAHLAGNLRDLDACVATAAGHALARGATVLVVSEYGIAPVARAAFPNRVLREAGLLEVAANAAGELLDPGASAAFAVCDHQIAHVSCRDPASLARARDLLSRLPGVGRILAGSERGALDHPRSGDLVLLAEPGCWFAHDYWLDERRAPDFARSVEIHRKPGYDPRELFFDPAGGRRRAALGLLRKALGLRYRLDAIPLDAGLVRGSHGLPPERSDDGPVIIASTPGLVRTGLHQRDVAGLIARHFTA